MKEQKIIISIDEDGKIIADAEGFKGSFCVSEIEELLKEVAKIDKIDKKPDYYDDGVRQTQTTRVQQR